MAATAAEWSDVRGTVEQLRERIRHLQAAPREYLATLQTGIAPWDGLFPGGGLPLASALELCGEAASGRSSLALRAVASAQKEQRLCAWLDGPAEFYPPTAHGVGVELQRLLIVRPPRQKLLWAAQQICRSGAFTCVVLDLTRTGLRMGLAEGKKLADAAFRGGALLLLLTTPQFPGDGMVRLKTSTQGPQGVMVEVVRHRQAGAGKKAFIPWEMVYPEWALKKVFLPEPGPEAPPREKPAFHRAKASEERNGGGLYASRPGRDCAFPRLGGSA